MNKSLLELLEAEKKEVESIKFYKISASDFIAHAVNKDEGYNPDVCQHIAQDYERDIKKSEENLIEIRKEIEQYISFLMKME